MTTIELKELGSPIQSDANLASEYYTERKRYRAWETVSWTVIGTVAGYATTLFLEEDKMAMSILLGALTGFLFAQVKWEVLGQACAYQEKIAATNNETGLPTTGSTRARVWDIFHNDPSRVKSAAAMVGLATLIPGAASAILMGVAYGRGEMTGEHILNTTRVIAGLMVCAFGCIYAYSQYAKQYQGNQEITHPVGAPLNHGNIDPTQPWPGLHVANIRH